MREKRKSTTSLLAFKIALRSTDMPNAGLSWMQAFGSAKGLGNSTEKQWINLGENTKNISFVTKSQQDLRSPIKL